MAIVGNVTKLEYQLREYNLKIVFNYFKKAMDPKSEVHKTVIKFPVKLLK